MNYILLCLLLLSLSARITLAEDSTSSSSSPTVPQTTIDNTETAPTPSPSPGTGSSSSATAIAVAPNTQTRDTRRDTTLTTTATDDLVQVTLQRQTTTSQQSQSSVSRTNLGLLLTSEPASKTTENDEDRSMFKILFTVPSDDLFYNANFKFGRDQEIQLRLDLIQPEIWVMNNQDFLDCNSVDLWIDSQISELSYTATTGGLPSEISTAPEYTSMCGYYGLYTSSETNMPQATNAIAATNYQSYRIPYMNAATAEGYFVTDDVEFNLTNGDYYVLPNITFLDADDTNVLVGGIGLAGTPKGSGFLYSLTNRNIINSPGYSLWFNNETDPDNAVAQLIPGAVNTKYYVGDLYQFNITPHRGYRFNASQQASNQDLIELTLPVIELDDILVSLSMMSNSEPLPVLIDSRSSYFYLPLDVIVSLAIQTNAYYSSQLARWVVKCQPLIDAMATIEFVIGSLSINIPITELITDAIYEGTVLNFETGEKACLLRVLPSSVSGYNSLGLPFLRYVYLVVDNEGGKIGLANLNKFMQNATSVSSSGTSIGYIRSGTIPFATINTESSEGDGTLSYSAVSRASDESLILHIPARFSGAIISGGSIYVTGEATGDLITTSALNATAADASSSGRAGRYQEAVVVDIVGVRIQSKVIPMITTLGLLLLTLL
ncbi:Aspartic proteinase yapsin-7 [Candida viswanathii]|uniref:Aspartic proteinase yapsin-7 n=1 Tax=Candida viswanathii TaxID=5486 RepID=A0A367YIS1_9ASCO|nr:Aspartic proteinase yapsin-7 [Candida viswanathii]